MAVHLDIPIETKQTTAYCFPEWFRCVHLSLASLSTQSVCKMLMISRQKCWNYFHLAHCHISLRFSLGMCRDIILHVIIRAVRYNEINSKTDGNRPKIEQREAHNCTNNEPPKKKEVIHGKHCNFLMNAHQSKPMLTNSQKYWLCRPIFLRYRCIFIYFVVVFFFGV